jgi:hypothetical protein
VSSPYRDAPEMPPLPCEYKPSVPTVIPIPCTLERGHEGPHQHHRWLLNEQEYRRLSGSEAAVVGTLAPSHWVDPQNLSMCLGGCPACARVAAAQQDEIDDNPLGFYTGAFGHPGAADAGLANRVAKLEQILDDHPRKRRF